MNISPFTGLSSLNMKPGLFADGLSSFSSLRLSVVSIKFNLDGLSLTVALRTVTTR